MCSQVAARPLGAGLPGPHLPSSLVSRATAAAARRRSVRGDMVTAGCRLGSHSYTVTLVAGAQQVLVTSDHYLDTDLTCAATQPLVCQNISPAVTCHLHLCSLTLLCDTNQLKTPELIIDLVI